MKGTGFRVISEWTDALKEGSGDSLKALARDPDALAIINDVWPMIARHLVQPPLRRIDPCWKMIGEFRSSLISKWVQWLPSGWFRILLTVLEKPLLVILFLMLLSHWLI